MNNKVFLHIGLHKTATTTLQSQFFTKITGLNYYWNNNRQIRLMVDMLTKKDPMYFDPASALGCLGEVNDDAPILISEESLSGAPFAGEREWGLDHRKAVFENSLKVFPGASVILVIRRQDKFAVSLYRQYLKFGGTQSLERFYGIDTEGDYYGLVSLDRFNYLTYIQTLHGMFSGRVLVLAFEEFVREQDVFLSKICSFVGVEKPDLVLSKSNETRMGDGGLQVARMINFIFKSKHNPGGLIPGLPIYRKGRFRLINPMPYLHDRWPIKGNISERSPMKLVPNMLLDRERSRNQELDAEFQLGLKEFGYY